MALDDPRQFRVTELTLISESIMKHALCVECIAAKSSMSVAATETTLAVIQRALDVHRAEARRCHSCDRTTVVFRLGRSTL